jgi:cholesterol oxidase
MTTDDSPDARMQSGDDAAVYDWIVIGSGFGGSVAALRLAEKGYRVAVIERGRRYRDEDFAATSWDARRFLWAPALGLRGIFRMSVFKDVFIASGSGVGGGSLVFANTLYRAKPEFFVHPQWPATANWSQVLAPHYATAERMLGMQRVPHASDGQDLLLDMARHFGAEHTFTRTSCAVYFGTPGVTVPDPYFGGEGPPRTGCLKCGACMVGCRTGAKNTLVKNYLWFAERRGVRIIPEREVVDIRPCGAPDGADGYVVETERPGAWLRRRPRSFRAGGVVVASGALGTNALLARCKHRGGLPALSDRLGHLVRTNSESLLAVTLPDDRLKPWNDVAISASFHPDADTHIEFVTYGEKGDALAALTTLLTGNGTRVTRPLLWLATVARHPLQFLRTLWPFGWSRRTLILLVMQSLDNALRFRARPWLFGRGVALSTEQDTGKPNPTFIAAGDRAARWLAARTGGLPQSMIVEALANIPATAHILGGAVIGRDASSGVVDDHCRVFNYRNLMICDGSVVPANPGVNPSLTITAIAEHAMSAVRKKAAIPAAAWLFSQSQ